MIEPEQLLKEIIRPVLRRLRAWSEPAERLVLGTACQESGCGRWLMQIGGPAIGIYQMEPATHEDIWNNYLSYHDELASIVKSFTIFGMPAVTQLAGNLYYATAMCRVHYLRFSTPIPEGVIGQARYWKQYYNTERGAGRVEDYVANWRRFVHDGEI